MTDEQIKKKLNQLVKLTNELDAESKKRYGPTGQLFFESGGAFHIMADDRDSDSITRQSFITFSSDGYSRLGAGAW